MGSSYRVHLWQIDYLPAFYRPGLDYLAEPGPLDSPDGAIARLAQAGLPGFESLLRDFRADYVEHVRRKLVALTRWSAGREARLVVFPEYAVPPEALADLRDIAAKASLTVVAGTHRVRHDSSSATAYAEAGLNVSTDLNGAAISPVLNASEGDTVVPKRSQSKWESDLPMMLPWPEKVIISGDARLVVRPCIDALVSTPSNAEDFDSAQIVVCPAMSPVTSPFETVGALMSLNEKVFGVSNSARFGGTTFGCPSAWVDLMAGPVFSKAWPLTAGSEALLEADFDVSHFVLPKGSVRSRIPMSRPRAFPVAYESSDRWLDEYVELRSDIDEFVDSAEIPLAIEAVDEFLSGRMDAVPPSIVDHLKLVRNQILTYYSGDRSVLRDALTLASLPADVEDTSALFHSRLVRALGKVMEALGSDDGAHVDALTDVLKALKRSQKDYPSEPNALISGHRGVAVDAGEADLAAFQDRGKQLDELRDVFSVPDNRVVVVGGYLGVGKTEFVRTVFAKILTDWQPRWFVVPPGTRFVTLLSRVAGAFGVSIDSDSLGRLSEGKFRDAVRRLLPLLFSKAKVALVFDDIGDYMASRRDVELLDLFFAEVDAAPNIAAGRIVMISSKINERIAKPRKRVARVSLSPLPPVFIKRVVEYQLRQLGSLPTERAPDIPQNIIDMIGGSPLVARIVAGASKPIGMDGVIAVDTEAVHGNALSRLLREMELDETAAEFSKRISVYRAPLDMLIADQVDAIPNTSAIHELANMGMIEVSARMITMHPIVRKYVREQCSPEEAMQWHLSAQRYYERLLRDRRYSDVGPVVEMSYHSVIVGDITKVQQMRSIAAAELLPAARELYRQHRRYAEALTVFRYLSELLPDDESVWASLARCYARLQQWQDSDQAFQVAIEVGVRSGHSIGWIHRDWGHIRQRFGYLDIAEREFALAREHGLAMEPSLRASAAYGDHLRGNSEDAAVELRSLVNASPSHRYAWWALSVVLEALGDEQGAAAARRSFDRLAEAVEFAVVTPREGDVEWDIEGDE